MPKDGLRHPIPMDLVVSMLLALISKEASNVNAELDMKEFAAEELNVPVKTVPI